ELQEEAARRPSVRHARGIRARKIPARAAHSRRASRSRKFSEQFGDLTAGQLRAFRVRLEHWEARECINADAAFTTLWRKAAEDDAPVFDGSLERFAGMKT